MKFRLAIVSGTLVAMLCGCKPNTNPVVDFVASPLDSKEDIKLSTTYKDKPVVVYMWATWCGPCRQFAPTLNDIAAKYQPKGIVFLAISVEKKDVIAKAEKEDPHKMTVLMDTFSSATEAVGADALPTIVVLDKEHRPVWGSKGIGKTTETDMRNLLDGLI